MGVDLWDGESTHNRSKIDSVISTAGLLFVTVEADEPGWLSILLESKQLSTLTASIRNACHNKQLLIRETFLWCFWE